MSCALGPDISIYQGDTYSTTFTVKDSSSVAINITGYVVTFALKKNVDDDTAVLTKTATLTDPANGIAVLSLSATDTNIGAEAYTYDVEFRSSGNGVVKTYQGKFEVCQDIA